MRFLIDSDRLIDHLSGDSSARELLQRLEPPDVAVSVISVMEIEEGLLRPGTEHARRAAWRLLQATTRVLPFTEREARRCASLRHALRQRGARVNQRSLDLMIAATAIEHGLTLVTRNTRDYEDIPDLLVR